MGPLKVLSVTAREGTDSNSDIYTCVRVCVCVCVRVRVCVCEYYTHLYV